MKYYLPLILVIIFAEETMKKINSNLFFVSLQKSYIQTIIKYKHYGVMLELIKKGTSLLPFFAYFHCNATAI